MLLSAAAMLGGSLRNLEHQNFGFNPDGRYLVYINPKLSNYKQEQLVPLFRGIQERLRAIPGVRRVSSATYAPLSGDQWGTTFGFRANPNLVRRTMSSADWTRVTPGFFDTLGAKMLSGRAITEGDNGNSRPVAVINEAFAKKYFPNQSPIGQHFGPAPEKNAGTYEIVGVVQNIHYVNGDFREPEGLCFTYPRRRPFNSTSPTPRVRRSGRRTSSTL